MWPFPFLKRSCFFTKIRTYIYVQVYINVFMYGHAPVYPPSLLLMETWLCCQASPITKFHGAGRAYILFCICGGMSSARFLEGWLRQSINAPIILLNTDKFSLQRGSALLQSHLQWVRIARFSPGLPTECVVKLLDLCQAKSGKGVRFTFLAC